MKTIVLFVSAIIISTGALLASLSMNMYPFIGPAIAFGVVVLFMFHLTGKSRKKARQAKRSACFMSTLQHCKTNAPDFTNR